MCGITSAHDSKRVVRLRFHNKEKIIKPTINGETKMPKVSIIIPAYNTQFVVGEAIASCLCQEFVELEADIEILLVDDGSSDGTLRTAFEFAARDSRVRVIPLSQNVGTFAARIAGIHEAKGEFVLFLDSDDVLPKHAVASYLRALHNEPNVEIVFADRITHSENAQKITRNFEHLRTPAMLYGAQIFAEVFAAKTWQSSRWTQTGKLYTRAILLRAIAFAHETWGEIPSGIAGFEDALFSFAILQFAQKALVIDKILYEYLWRNRAEKMRNIVETHVAPHVRFMHNARVIGLMQALADTQKVRNSALCMHTNALLQHIKYDYYAGQRHGDVFVALDAPDSVQTSIFPIYLRAVTNSMRYGKRGRAILRVLLFMISLGRIRR